MANFLGHTAAMDMTRTAEKWGGRVLLFCFLGMMVLISVFAVNVIGNPGKARDPLMLGALLGGFSILGAPVGLLMTVLPILRRINRKKDCKQYEQQNAALQDWRPPAWHQPQEAQPFSWMHKP